MLNKRGSTAILLKILTDEGTLVKLTAVLSYKEEMAENTFYARLYPPKLNRTDKLLKKLDAEMERLDEETRDEKYLTLPLEVDGIPVILISPLIQARRCVP